MHYKVWSEITYQFSIFKGAGIEVWEWILGMWLFLRAGIEINPYQ